MTAALHGLIRPSRDGTFECLSEPEPGALSARLLPVYDGGEQFDTIAWAPERPAKWWTNRALVTHLGTEELSRAWWLNRPAYFVETPARFLECQERVACIIDWTADLDRIIGQVDAVVCETPALCRRLRETLLRQSRPGIVDRITAYVRRRAAA